MPASKAGLISIETPIKATEYLLDNSPPGYLFHAMSFGSYLIWAAQPDYPVFVDGRIEMYPMQVWMDYLQISQASGDWEQRLQDYGVRSLLLSDKEQPGLVEAVRNNPHWKLLYADEAALLFVSR